MTLFLIGIGGAAGAAARYQLGRIFPRTDERVFPRGTFLINLLGTFLLGFFSGLHLSGNPYFLLGDGFCGAFTTFSSFALEGTQLIRGGLRKKAAGYIFLTLLSGLLCFVAGRAVGLMM